MIGGRREFEGWRCVRNTPVHFHLGRNSSGYLHIFRPESKRDQFADRMPLDRCSIAASTQYRDVAAAELRGLEDRLPAAAAGGADYVARSADYRDPGDVLKAERMLCGGQRAL